MCNTVPKVIAKLGHDKLDGFTKKEFIAAFLADGYGIQKAERHFLMCLLSHAITEHPTEENSYISIHCPWHWQMYEDVLKDVEVLPVKIERDGRITRII